MSGIYIHIPFCKQACHYCDFHFSTSLNYSKEIIDAIQIEIEQRREEMSGPVETVYFGGGTPSILNEKYLIQLLNTIHTHIGIEADAEITLEANPDDLNLPFLIALKQAGFNRISLGVQSFDDAVLKRLNRVHTSGDSLNALDIAYTAGFNQFSLDLIYGIPGQSDTIWEKDLEKASKTGVNHLSCYHLTVEPKTMLQKLIQQGKSPQPDEEDGMRHFNILLDIGPDLGFEWYEISNFARNNKVARHNSNYWKGLPYLGIGPSAHSFDGKNRRVNVPNNTRYFRELLAGNEAPHHIEYLENFERYNEWVMTRLRMKAGIPLNEKTLISEIQKDYLKNQCKAWIESGHLKIDEQHVCLTRKGILIADHIASDLFLLK